MSLKISLDKYQAIPYNDDVMNTNLKPKGEAKMTYQIQFAPDGQRWQKVKQANSANKLWDDFNFNTEYKVLKAYIPTAKFRLINITDNFTIG
jgi:hypothetical protein